METRTVPSEPHRPSDLHGAEDILELYVDMLDAARRVRVAPPAAAWARAPRPVAKAPAREREPSRV